MNGHRIISYMGNRIEFLNYDGDVYMFYADLRRIANNKSERRYIAQYSAHGLAKLLGAENVKYYTGKRNLCFRRRAKTALVNVSVFVLYYRSSRPVMHIDSSILSFLELCKCKMEEINESSQERIVPFREGEKDIRSASKPSGYSLPEPLPPPTIIPKEEPDPGIESENNEKIMFMDFLRENMDLILRENAMLRGRISELEILFRNHKHSLFGGGVK